MSIPKPNQPIPNEAPARPNNDFVGPLPSVLPLEPRMTFSYKDDYFPPCCFDHRFPSFNTVTPDPFSRQGFLPAGAYMFNQNGAVTDYCCGGQVSDERLMTRTTGPKYGATMGACMPRAVQSSVLDVAGSFTPFGVMGDARARSGCFL